MKKLAAFGTAAVLFAIIVAVVHLCIIDSRSLQSSSMGTWSNCYKDLSYNALKDNIKPESMVVFGSSEFNHGKRTEYHLANLFKNQDIDIMIIGEAYNQSLSHAIALGALEKNMKNRRVVLIVSPTWFYKDGVRPENYSLRFSESNYIAMMKNKNVSQKTKEYISKRSEKLLKGDNAMKRRVKRYDRVYLGEKGGVIDRSLCKLRERYLKDKEIITVSTAYKLRDYGKKKARTFPHEKGVIDWNGLVNQAEQKGESIRNNPYGMKDRKYRKFFKNKVRKSENIHVNSSLETSPEYEDLKCFLEICKETGVEPLLILQPLNGYWYDHTGMGEEKRQVFYDKVGKIAQEYGVRTSDMSNMDYSRNFFEDAVHPAGKGWVIINEKIYDYYKENNVKM